MPDESRPAIETHPLLTRLLSHNVEGSVLRGYVGPSDKPGTIRLYPTLGFLHLYYEISEDDILDTAPAPKPLLPHDGTVVWVRSAADVVLHGDTVVTVPVRTLKAKQRAVREPAAEEAAPAEAGKYVDVVRGRLRMTVQGPAVTKDDVCASCAPCSSCGVCTTTCSVQR